MGLEQRSRGPVVVRQDGGHERFGVDLSVIIPAHNEAPNLPPLLDELAEGMRAVPPRPGGWAWTWEAIVVDDGSTDGTAETLAELLGRYPWLRALRLESRSGQSAGLVAGFAAARGRWVATIDADLQNDPRDFPRLIAALDQHDAAIGWRRNRRDTWRKRIVSRCANAVRNWMLGERIHDTGCALRVFRRDAAGNFPRFHGMHRFVPALLAMQGGRIAQVAVNHRPRVHGRTHYTIVNRFLGPIIDLCGVAWLGRRRLHFQATEMVAGRPESDERP